MAGGTRHTNFCNNIEAYHKKKEEEQFYDFTIRDKDDLEVKSHKFILASQCDYFAALFRFHSNCRETKFINFSNDEIKICIEYLYTQKVNLTERNVENVLMFADYINLTDVRGICIDYIIKHIDQSNLGHVIGLGYKLEIKQLIEAGVKNLGPQDINSLDTFSKDMINDVVRLQQEQVTIMTQGQWKFNLIKQWLTAPNDEMGFEARGSSVYGTNNLHNWGPKFAIDGEVSNNDYFYFHSEHEMHPWLEVRFPSPVLISSVTIINRKNGCWARLRNVEVRAGMTPVPDGFTARDRGYHSNKKLQVNNQCGHFEGPARGFVSEGHTIVFDRPTLAQYVTLQILDKEYL
ncbi:hypothetical protein ABFA07_001462 [Porites harrisoni]